VGLADAEIEDVSFAGANAHDAVADNDVVDCHYATDVSHPQAIPEDSLAPWELIGSSLDGNDLGNIVFVLERFSAGVTVQITAVLVGQTGTDWSVVVTEFSTEE